jgi:hypothetical protein
MAGDSSATGEVSLRVAPEQLKQVFDRLGSEGRIVMHATESDDKTGTVIDVEAKLESLTGFRDSLRAMQARPTASVKDLVEIQRELSNVQSELDSLITKRKVLANETEKVAVDIAFRSRASAGLLAPLGAACGELALVFFQSLATLITVIVTVAPWLILVLPGLWGLKKVVRRFSRSRSPAA